MCYTNMHNVGCTGILTNPTNITIIASNMSTNVVVLTLVLSCSKQHL